MIYSYLVLPYNVTVSVEADAVDEAQPIQYQGVLASVVKARLAGAYGAFGHLFSPDADSPISLQAALINTFGADRVQEVGEPIEEVGADVPEDAVT